MGSSAGFAEGGSGFLSFGMLVLDELRFPSKPTLRDVVGGSGTWATLGARLASSLTESKTVACIILAGDDFPDEILRTFQAWDITLEIRRMPGRTSTRGLLQYEDDFFGRKTFQYTTPPLQLVPRDLEGTTMLQSAAFHILARPANVETQVADLHALRARQSLDRNPIVVWEPFPPLCDSSHREAHLRACRQVDVFSPNHLELMRLFEARDRSSNHLDRRRIEGYAQRFLAASLEDGGAGTAIVVRAGEHGCLILSKRQDCRWLEPFFDSTSPRVVDATGAGNCFLGAFAVAFSRTGDLAEAAIHGTVAASFAIEQIGLPTLERMEGQEAWNGTTFERRLGEYRRRTP